MLNRIQQLLLRACTCFQRLQGTQQPLTLGLDETLQLPATGLVGHIAAVTHPHRNDQVTMDIALIHQALEHIVHCHMSRSAQQHPLAFPGQLQDQLADRRGLAGAGRPLQQSKIRGLQGDLDKLALLIRSWSRRIGQYFPVAICDPARLKIRPSGMSGSFEQPEKGAMRRGRLILQCLQSIDLPFQGQGVRAQQQLESFLRQSLQQQLAGFRITIQHPDLAARSEGQRTATPLSERSSILATFHFENFSDVFIHEVSEGGFRLIRPILRLLQGYPDASTCYRLLVLFILVALFTLDRLVLLLLGCKANPPG
ncbi:hypothetical protein D3C78_1146350 [compost metagenome]